MAEDGTNNNLDTTDDDGSRPQTSKSKNRNQQQSKQQKPRQQQQKTRQQQQTKETKKEKCRPRIDQLAIPSRRLILALYQEHADHLPKDKVEKIKVLLQELYAMTPEETEKYFEDLRKKSRAAGQRNDIKYMLKKLVRRRKKARQIQKAYDFITNLLVRGMEYASKNKIPPLVSVRLRYLSNIILEQICYLRNVNIPNRDDPDAVGAFLIQVADWMAVAIEHLYYGVQLKKNAELEKIEKEAKSREMKPKSKTDASKDDGKTKPADSEKGEDDTEAVISEPLLLSEIE